MKTSQGRADPHVFTTTEIFYQYISLTCSCRVPPTSPHPQLSPNICFSERGELRSRSGPSDPDRGAERGTAAPRRRQRSREKRGRTARVRTSARLVRRAAVSAHERAAAPGVGTGPTSFRRFPARSCTPGAATTCGRRAAAPGRAVRLGAANCRGVLVPRQLCAEKRIHGQRSQGKWKARNRREAQLGNAFPGPESRARSAARCPLLNAVETVASRGEPRSQRKCLDNGALRESC